MTYEHPFGEETTLDQQVPAHSTMTRSLQPTSAKRHKRLNAQLYPYLSSSLVLFSNLQLLSQNSKTLASNHTSQIQTGYFGLTQLLSDDKPITCYFWSRGRITSRVAKGACFQKKSYFRCSLL
eukprot:3462660-Amphidinium_carterae.1